MVDRISLIIITFIVMFVTTAGLLVTGTVPVIFKTSTVVNETSFENKNQTKIMMNFVKLYLKNMDEDTKATVAGLVAADIIAKNATEKQNEILNMNANITKQILNMSHEHKQVVGKMDNLSKLNHQLLERHVVNTSLAEGKAEEAVNQSNGR